MRTYSNKQITIRDLSLVSCDICKEADAPNKIFVDNMLSLEYTFGYGSRHDGETWELDLCQNCVEQYLLKFMKKKIEGENGHS